MVPIGPTEYVALTAAAFVTVSALLGPNLLKGIASLLIGITLSMIGIDSQTGQPRLTFGTSSLLDGIDVVIVVVALFALTEAFGHLVTGTGKSTVQPLRGRAAMSRSDLRRSWPAWLRGTALGFPIGSLPAGGAEVPTFLSYTIERRLTRHPQQFGHGAIEGVAGPEAANNAAAAGVLVPLLTIGLPTSATAAVILTAFQSYGLQPGPQLFSESGPLVWTLIASLYLGNLMLLVLNLPLVKIWARILTIPAYTIYAGVLVFATLGAFAAGGTVVDLIVLTGLGLLGLLMREARVPVAPAIVGLILGPVAEQQLRRALTLSDGDPGILVSGPITITLWFVVALSLLVPVVLPVARRRRAELARGSAPEDEETYEDSRS